MKIKNIVTLIVLVISTALIYFFNSADKTIANELDYLRDIAEVRAQWEEISEKKVGEIPKQQVEKVLGNIIDLNIEGKEIKNKIGEEAWLTFEEVIHDYYEYDALLIKDTILSLKYAKNHPYQLILSQETLDMEKQIPSSITQKNKENMMKDASHLIQTLGIDIQKVDEGKITEFANETYEKQKRGDLVFLNFIFSDLNALTKAFASN
ncbi:hypothetical protein KBB89_01630 [Candidatus Gracilibacteria bacterium]|nr:hypothetical protein [Candidatus Gracilibacteria bacterium]